MSAFNPPNFRKLPKNLNNEILFSCLRINPEALNAGKLRKGTYEVELLES